MTNVRKALEKALTALGGLLLLAMFLVMMSQVVFRYVLSAPLPWPEELSLFMMGPLTFIGAYLAIIHEEHLNISFLLDISSPQVKAVMKTVGKLIIAAFLAITVFYGYDFIQKAGLLKTAVMKIPMWVTYGTIWLCCLLMLLETLLQLVLILRGLPRLNQPAATVENSGPGEEE